MSAAALDRRMLLVGVLAVAGLDTACVRRVPHFGEVETTCEATACVSETAEGLTETGVGASSSGDSTTSGGAGETCEAGCSTSGCDGACTNGDICPEGCCAELSACLEEDAADECDALCDCPRYVFASRDLFVGNMGGVEGADSLCGAIVDALHDPEAVDCERRRFMAMLSIDELRTAADYGDEGFSGAYILPNGVTVAKGWSGLRETLQEPINIAEDGSPVDGFAWTGVERGYHCNKWTSEKESSKGSAGDISRTDVLLQNVESGKDCDQGLRLLCVEVPRRNASERP